MASRIEIERGVERVYEVWQDLDAYPQFMPHVDRIEHEGDALRVTSTVDGVSRSWPAEIAEHVTNQSIAWRALDGTDNGGRVELRPRGAHRTEVALYLQVDVRQFAHHRGDSRAVAERIEREALLALRSLLEPELTGPDVPGTTDVVELPDVMAPAPSALKTVALDGGDVRPVARR